VLLPGTAHLPNMEQPEEFNRVVLEFLAKVDGA
jgi:pimeloyl-ACP methyl ester carboxylesterase